MSIENPHQKCWLNQQPWEYHWDSHGIYMVIMGFEHGFLCRIGVELIYLQFWWTLMKKRAVIVETETLRCRNHWTTQWISNLTLNSWIWRIYRRKYIWWPLWIHSHPSRMTASWPSVGPKAAWLEPNHKMEWRCRIFRHSMDWFKETPIGNKYFLLPWNQTFSTNP